jgi:hypothetical protein
MMGQQEITMLRGILRAELNRIRASAMFILKPSCRCEKDDGSNVILITNAHAAV